MRLGGSCRQQWTCGSKPRTLIDVTQLADPSPPVSLTARGRATRERILTAAAAFIRCQGVAPTSLKGVRAATGVGKSQTYRYFADRSPRGRHLFRTDLTLELQ